MRVEPTKLAGVVVIEPVVYGDARGFFFETWNRRRYTEAGLPMVFVQDNISQSRQGTVRGLHFQNPQPQGKLVSVLEGEIFDVAVDIQVGSPTFGEWVGVRLSSENRRQIYVPVGFAHGFCVISPTALVNYKCTDFYNGGTEGIVAWNDPEIGIEWPVREPVLSEKDLRAPRLREIAAEKLFRAAGET